MTDLMRGSTLLRGRLFGSRAAPTQQPIDMSAPIPSDINNAAVSRPWLLEATPLSQWSVDAAIRGAADRLTPILMTSIVTALGVLPLAIGMADPGRAIEGPMAVVILGGLLPSMALNLLVLPTLALRYGRFEPAADEFGGAERAAAPSGGNR